MPHPLHQPVLRWYEGSARDLPWRRPDRTPWGVLVSEFMLQQTPVTRVLPVWREWLRRWPTPAELAAASPGEAVRAWGRLGYPRRALRLHEVAVALAQSHGGMVPTSYDDLRALPGVGDYTAAAVASFAHGGRHAVVDTNVRRVLARVLAGQWQAAPALTRADVERAAQLVPVAPETAAIWAVALMELGALVRTSRRPACDRCPVADQCAWLRDGQASDRATPGQTSEGKAGRRSQRWHGTDRQVRGKLLAVVREAPGAVPAGALVAAVPAAGLADLEQRDRALASLLADGLLVRRSSGDYALPD